jgi:hypothetical protein
MERQVPLSEMTKSERWMPVVGYEGLYEVSDYGNVRSLARKRTSTNYYIEYECVRPGKLLSQHKDKYGYKRIAGLTDAEGKKSSTQQVHRLVLMAFIGKPPNPDYHCNHKDCNKTNNRLDNLEWVSQSENHKHAVKNGIHTVCLHRDPQTGKVRSRRPTAHGTG